MQPIMNVTIYEPALLSIITRDTSCLLYTRQSLNTQVRYMGRLHRHLYLYISSAKRHMSNFVLLKTAAINACRTGPIVCLVTEFDNEQYIGVSYGEYEGYAYPHFLERGYITPTFSAYDRKSNSDFTSSSAHVSPYNI